VNFLVAGPNISVVTNGFDSENLTLPLNFTPTGQSSRMMTAAGPEIVSILANQPVTMNNHQAGVAPSSFNSNPVLPTFFQVISSNVDRCVSCFSPCVLPPMPNVALFREGTEFLSTMEAFNYPIYITQWHPEKVQFEWDSDEGINHSYPSIQVRPYPLCPLPPCLSHALFLQANSFFARFFVNEARGNMNAFPTVAAETAALIYNYSPVFTGPALGDFEQCYFFN
jgi:gamma-glutamyl hydrolase